MNDYRIELGIGLKTDDFAEIKKKINSLEDNPIKLKVDAETTELTRTIKEALNGLSKGSKNTLTLDTSKLEGSIADIRDAVVDLKKVFGSLDDGANFKPLLTSINQIANALGKVENESDNLVKSLSTLSKRDFNINFGIDMGKKNNNMIAYGRAARKQVIPELEAQIKELEGLFGGQQATMRKLTTHGKNVGFDIFTDFGDFNSDSAIKKMEAMEKYIDSLKRLAVIDNIKLDGFNEVHKNASELIDDIAGVESAVDKAGDVPDKIKKFFGSGLDVESLSGQLQPIITDLNEIKTAIQSLSSGISVDGLTQSFDRLSDTLERLTSNLSLAKNTLDTGFSNTAPVNNAVKVAQQTGQKIGETVGKSATKSAKQSINLDDVIDEQTLALMNKFSISGDKGSDSFNKIRQALVECRNELNILKNSDIGIDEEVFDTSRAVDKVTDAIANQMRAVNSLGDEYIELANYMTRFNDPTKGNKVRLPDVVKQEQGDDYRSSRGSLGIAFNTERGISFVDFINDLNHELGETISLTNGEAAAMDELLRKVELGRKQRDVAKKSEKYLYDSLSAEEILEQNGINREEIYSDTMSAVDAVNTAERESARVSADTTNTIVQNEERKQRAYQETRRLISDVAQDSIDEVSSKSIDRAFRVDESDSIAFRREMENLVSQWTNAKGELTDIKIDTSTVYDKDTGRHIEKIRQAQITYNNELGETIKKTIALRQIGTEAKIVDGKEMTSPMYGFVEVSGQYSKSLGKTKVQTDAFVKQQKQAVSNLTNQINQLNRAANDQNASRPIKDASHLDTLKNKYNEVISAIQRMGATTTDTFSDEQNNVKSLISDYKSLVSEFKNAENVSTKMKGTDFDSGLEIARNDLEKLKAQAKDFPQITQTIENLDNAIEGVGDASSLNKFNDQLRVARSELAKIKSETVAANRSEKVGINVSGLESKIADLQRISPEVDKFEAEIDGAKVSVQSLLADLKRVNTQSDFSVVNSKWKAFTDAAKAAGIAVSETATKARATLANDIKINIELGNFENEMDAMRTKFNGLSDANVELRTSVESVENAYQEMLKVANANTGDEVADRERLIQAEKEYAAALEKTNNLIKIQARADKAENDKLKLQDNREKFQVKIDAWMAKNSAATKQFGAQLLDLRAKAEKADQVDLNHLEAELYKIDKAADKAGLKMQSFGDQIKSKFKEYMAYFSVAEVFMYVEQGLREMFNTVKEIDTAMTGLYRVTDLTAHQYDTLFNNMINSAKEYGATLNDVINATTDWVRAGFDADVALGMAEVTTMYQHISDLDYDTAAENLITAYNGFKNELNGAFDGDQVAAVNYIADILNELDKQNCP